MVEVRLTLTLTPRSRHVLELAEMASRLLGVDYIGTEHILIGLVAEREGIAGGILSKSGVTAETVYRALSEMNITRTR